MGSDTYDAEVLLGEISGDYKNNNYDSYNYNYTVLDDFLDFNRKLSITQATYNIIKAMCASRENTLCNVDFSGLFFSCLPSFCRYSDDGKFPCNFIESKINSLPFSDSVDTLGYLIKDNITVIYFPENSDIIIWNTEDDTVIGDYNFCSYIIANDGFICMILSDDNNTIYILTDIYMMSFELQTGKPLLIYDNDEPEYIKTLEQYNSNKDNLHVLDEKTYRHALSLIDRFRDCDFRRAKLRPEDKRILGIMERL